MPRWVLPVVALLLVAGCSSSERTTATISRETAIVSEEEAVVQEETVSTSRPLEVELPLPLPEPVATDTVEAGRFDQGRMWTFDAPPTDYFREAYSLQADSAWFAEARLGALRIPGCSASFVSPYGLMLTNHHCGRGYLPDVQEGGEDLLTDGYYASSLDAERRAEGLYAEQLIAIEDVTDEVYAALASAETAAERQQALADVRDRIAERIKAETEGDPDDLNVEVIELYNGGRYSAYTFRRYRDVRLAFAPELQLGYFGGDPDNFTYPRFSLDMMLFRVYDEGEPLATPTYFPWAQHGVEQGEAVFVIGNPGSTYRLETLAQLAWRRAVSEEATLSFYVSRKAALQAALERNPDPAIQNLIFSLSNAEKLYRGRVEAVYDPILTARRADAQAKLIAALEADPALAETYVPLFDEMEEIQEQKEAEYAAPFSAFLGFQPGGTFTAPTFGRALLALEYVDRSEAGASDEELAELREQIVTYEERVPGADRALMEARLQDVQTYFGFDDSLTQAVLGGLAPAERAQQIAQTSSLANPERLRAVLRAGALTRDDPAIAVVAALKPVLDAYRSAWAGLTAQEQELARQLGRARYEVYSTSVPPDATFSLRIADGRVEPYPYNGTIAPVYTTFFGLYEQYHAYADHPSSPWALPERWLNPPASFDLGTPYNFVATTDIVGGNSGSAVVNRNLELVGLAFDGNIESLSNQFIFTTERARAVMVDVRGMREVLDHVYDADRLVLELMAGDLVGTEAEADARMATPGGD